MKKILQNLVPTAVRNHKRSVAMLPGEHDYTAQRRIELEFVTIIKSIDDYRKIAVGKKELV